MARLVLLPSLAFIVMCTTPAKASATVKAIAPEGEATIYLTGAFSRGFNVAYDVVLGLVPRNRSSTFVGIMLTGREHRGPAIELGLTRSGSNSNALGVFTAVITRYSGNRYTVIPAACAPACELVLRGDRTSVNAFLVDEDGILKLGTWNRSDFRLAQPYVELNGEVTRPRDRIIATLMPMRVVVDSRDLPQPTCGFTTGGILPARDRGGALTFSGTYRTAGRASFIDLKSGRTVDRCPQGRSSTHRTSAGAAK